MLCLICLLIAVTVLARSGAVAAAENARPLEVRFNSGSTDRQVQFTALMLRLSGASERARAREINRFFNRIPRRSDLETWGREDYWATPSEFLTGGGGDCEDYAIAKYFALRALGVTDERLAITYVRIAPSGRAHMVLLYVPNDGTESVVLDNRHSRVLPLSQRTDLVPVYGLNASAVFVPAAGRAPAHGRRLVHQRIRRWDNLLARRRAEVGLTQ